MLQSNLVNREASGVAKTSHHSPGTFHTSQNGRDNVLSEGISCRKDISRDNTSTCMPRFQPAQLNRFLRLDPRRTVLHGVCVLGAGVIGASPPMLVGLVIDKLFRPDAPDSSIWLWWTIPALLLGSLLFAGFSYGSAYLSSVVSENAANRFQVELYRHLQRLSADFYQLNRVGEVTSRLTQDINRGIRPLYTHIVDLSSGIIMLVTAAAAIAWVSPVLLGVFLALFTLDVFIGLRALPRIYRNFQQLQDDNGALNARFCSRSRSCVCP
jgi:ABC-type multidrug transport system fused ATPase/permease subunit